MKNLKWLAFLFVAVLSLGFVSCSDDDDEDDTTITIVNNSSYSFNYFTVYFLNARTNDGGEVISRQNFGDVNPGKSITADIPAGASYYWVGMYNGGTNYVSADYAISVTHLNIDNNFRWYN